MYHAVVAYLVYNRVSSSLWVFVFALVSTRKLAWDHLVAENSCNVLVLRDLFRSLQITLLQCKRQSDFEFFFHHKNPIDIGKASRIHTCMRRKREHAPNIVCPVL